MSFNLGKLISNDWDLRLCGRERRIWEQGRFNGISQIIRQMPFQYIESSFCWMFCSQMLALRYKFISDYFMCSDADCIGKLLTNGDLLLILEWSAREASSRRHFGKNGCHSSSWHDEKFLMGKRYIRGQRLQRNDWKWNFRLKEDISIPWTSPLPEREWNAQPSGKCKMTRD